MPKSERELVGQKFDLYSVEGRVCTVSVSGLFVKAAAQPHFGQIQTWNGERESPVVSNSQRATELWSLSEMAGRYLMARFEAKGESCKGAMWGRAAELTAPKIWKRRSTTPDENVEIFDVVRKYPEYRKYQKGYVAVRGSRGWGDESAHSRVFNVFEDGRGAFYASITLTSKNAQGCGGDFSPDLFLLLKKHGDSYRIVSYRIVSYRRRCRRT